MILLKLLLGSAIGSALALPASHIDNSLNRTAGGPIVSFERRAAMECANRQKAAVIRQSYADARSVAAAAANRINRRGNEDLFTIYFGTSDRVSVANVFTQIAQDAGSETLNCYDPLKMCTGDALAYTHLRSSNIYFCDSFFKASGSEAFCSAKTGDTFQINHIRAAVTLHELGHAVAKLSDVTYGDVDSRLLAQQDPKSAARNADSYMHYAAEAFRRARCR